MEKIVYDTIIIGSGPAGLTAAIYSIRADSKTLVIGGGQPGGQLTITTLVENYPGFEKGIGGPKLMMDMLAQVKNLGGQILSEEVVKVNKSKDLFEVELRSKQSLKTRTVIVATGAKAKWLGIPGEKELMGRGVSGCATCDGMFFRDKTVAVVGGGDVACTDALFLAKFAKKVYLIHRRDQLRASTALQKRTFEEKKIDFLWNTEVKRVVGKDKVEMLSMVNNQTNKENRLVTDGFFVAIGHDPSTGFISGLVDLKESGHVIVDKLAEFETMTSQAGIFAAGDCVDDKYRQAVIAAGDGARAAMDVEKWLSQQ